MMILYFLFLAALVLQSDYAFTDDNWALWHAPDHYSNLKAWISQGRFFSGYMQQWLFSWAGRIERLKYLRLLSWAGWVGCTMLLYGVLRRIRKHKDIVLDDWTIMLTVAYAASSFFTLIYIGWTVCVEVFIPTALSLAAGLFLFEKRSPVLALILGVIALFFYQTCYPFLLLPFYCLFLSRKDGKFTAPMRWAILYLVVGLGIYYILFRWSLPLMGFIPSERTALKFDPLGRLSFFFSYPMNQAFCVNIFFNTGSAASQAIFPIVFVAWLLFEFFCRKRKPLVTLGYVSGMLLWWALGYLPQLIASESFGPYRSMPVLGVMVFLLLADAMLYLIKDARRKQMISFSLVAIFLLWGAWVFYAYQEHPLREEYRSVRQEVVSRYNARVKEVVFVLADEDGFLSHYGVRHYKDEFGLPATFKDWTPEWLVRQIVYETTGRRHEAEMLKVSVYRHTSEIPDRSILTHDDVMFIDAHTLF